MSTNGYGADAIAAERNRQKTVEGYTAEHDRDQSEELITAAACYLGAETWRRDRNLTPLDVPTFWPWEDVTWKPSGDPVRDLIKAGALIAAAIDALRSES